MSWLAFIGKVSVLKGAAWAKTKGGKKKKAFDGGKVQSMEKRVLQINGGGENH